MAAGMPNSRRNLDIAIERAFGATDDPVRIRNLMANTVVGQLLPKGAIKGGSSLKFRYGNKATRFTRDLDAARSDELEGFIQDIGGHWGRFLLSCQQDNKNRPQCPPMS